MIRPSGIALQRSAIGLLLGATTVAGFAPFGLFFLPPLTLGLLQLLWLFAPTPRAAARDGFAFGFGLFAPGICWLYISLHDFGGMPAIATVLAIALLASWLALFPALVGWIQVRLRLHPAPASLLALPALWALTEWTRGWMFTGFPWLSLGYSQTPWGPLSGFAPLLGVYGVSLMVALSAGCVALAAVRRNVRPLLSLALLWTMGWGLQQATWTTPLGEPFTVSLLQGNIPQDIKFDAKQLERTLFTYRDLTQASPSRLIVLPESALPLFKDDVPPDYLNLLEQQARANHGDLLVGMFVEENGAYYNSMFSLGTSPPQHYRKQHLVPFGEYIPLRPLLGWLVNSLVAIPMSDQQHSTVNQPPFRIAGQVVDVDICYEDVFGEELIRNLPAATVLVNVSNDAWFGRRLGPWQHLQIAQTRALETGRMMLRSTNTGVTAIVDVRGRVVKAVPQEQAVALHGTAQGYQGATPYVSGGNAPVVMLGLVALLGAGLWSRRLMAVQPGA